MDKKEKTEEPSLEKINYPASQDIYNQEEKLPLDEQMAAETDASSTVANTESTGGDPLNDTAEAPTAPGEEGQ